MIYTNCEHPFYMFPYGIQDDEYIKSIIDQEYLDHESAKNTSLRSYKKEILVSARLVQVSLTEKAQAEKLLELASKYKELSAKPLPVEEGDVRLIYIFNEFERAADEIMAESGNNAVFFSGVLTSCEYDAKLHQSIIDRMLINIKQQMTDFRESKSTS